MSKGQDRIPTASRLAVQARDKGRCVMCGGQGSEWHHRRTRATKDQHRHEACNGIWLCKTDHDFAHSHPLEARASGWIVSKFISDPSSVPVETWHGLVYLTCEGGFTKEQRDAG